MTATALLAEARQLQKNAANGDPRLTMSDTTAVSYNAES